MTGCRERSSGTAAEDLCEEVLVVGRSLAIDDRRWRRYLIAEEISVLPALCGSNGLIFADCGKRHNLSQTEYNNPHTDAHHSSFELWRWHPF